MTCIVGIEVGDKVFLGGDIQGTGGNSKVIHTQAKVFNKKGVLFGYTTSYRFGQIIEHNLQDPVIPNNDSEVYRWLITVLIPDIKKSLSDNGYTGGGNCLIGVKGQLWELQDDFSVLRSIKGYSAVGSGTEYAIASIFTAYLWNGGCTTNKTIVEDVIKQAIYCAGTFSPSVGTDSCVIST